MNLRFAFCAIIGIVMLSATGVGQTTRIVYPTPPWKGHGNMQVQPPIEVTETLLDSDAALDFEPAISGKYITYTTDRNGTYDVYYNDYYGFPDPLVVGSGKQHEADIDGTTAVYVDDSYGQDDIWVIDVETFDKKLIVSDASKDYAPAISESYVVFVTTRNGSKDIYYYDLLLGGDDPLFVGPVIQDQPDIDGDLVAWREIDGFKSEIYTLKLNAWPPLQVTHDPEYANSPSVSGNRIAYIIKDNAMSQYSNVEVYNVISTQTNRITNNSYSVWSVDISDNNVVYSDNRNGNYDIFLYDLSTGHEYQLTDDPFDQIVSDIDGNVAVFEDDRYGNNNVWKVEWKIHPSRKKL